MYGAGNHRLDKGQNIFKAEGRHPNSAIDQCSVSSSFPFRRLPIFQPQTCSLDVCPARFPVNFAKTPLATGLVFAALLDVSASALFLELLLSMLLV